MMLKLRMSLQRFYSDKQQKRLQTNLANNNHNSQQPEIKFKS